MDATARANRGGRRPMTRSMSKRLKSSSTRDKQTVGLKECPARIKRTESENDTSSTKSRIPRWGEKRRVLGELNILGDGGQRNPSVKRSKTVDDSLDKLSDTLGSCSLNEALLLGGIAEEVEVTTEAQSRGGATSTQRETDLFFAPDYSTDITSYLMEQEMSPPYLFVPDEEVLKPPTRAVLVDWIIQVQAHLQLEPETLHICIGLIDIYTSQYEIMVSQLQLLGVTALLIAAKLVQRFPPEVDELVRLTDFTYDREAVLTMETQLLKRLRFSVSVPTAVAFAEHFLRAIELIEGNPADNKMNDLTSYLIDLCLVDKEAIRANPSKRAAAAVGLSRSILHTAGLLGEGVEVWPYELARHTTYTYEEIFPVVRRLAKVLMRMKKLKHQGCYEKYLRREYCSISKWEYLSLSSPALIAILEQHPGTFGVGIDL